MSVRYRLSLPMTVWRLASLRNASIPTPLQCVPMRCHAGKATSVRSRLVALATLPRRFQRCPQVIRKFGDVPDDLSAL
jgi:hypothetical protein